MPLLAAIVATLIASWLGGIGGDMPGTMIQLGTRFETFPGNMPLLAAIVATLIASWLGAIGGDMPGISTIETTTV